MMAVTHCIEEFQLDIAFSSEALARREQGLLAQWLGDELLPALDALFSKHSPGYRRLRFERLEFNLGQLRGQNYQQQIKQQLLEKISALLRERRLELPQAQAVSGEVNSPAKALEQLVMFLRTGQLPWHNDANIHDQIMTTEVVNGQAIAQRLNVAALAHHQQLLASLVHNPALPEALRNIPERELLVQRLVSQFRDDQLSALLKNVAPAFYQELVPVWQLLSNWRTNYSSNAGSLKQFWWKNVFRLWLSDAHSPQKISGSVSLANIGWPAKILQQLARDLSVPAEDFYQQLIKISRQIPVDSKGEFIRYLRGTASSNLAGVNLSSAPGLHPLGAAPMSASSMSAGALKNPAQEGALLKAPDRFTKKTPAPELRYQLARIFNAGQGEALALLWPELLTRHSALLRAALTHYLPLSAIRQKIALQFSLELLGDIFNFLQPEWKLAEIYPFLAQHTDASAAAIERDLWEISLNHYVRRVDDRRMTFLPGVLAELAYRQGFSVERLLAASEANLGSDERQRLAELLGETTAKAAEVVSELSALGAQPEQTQKNLASPMDEALWVALQGVSGQKLLPEQQDSFLAVLASLANANTPATALGENLAGANLASALKKIELLPAVMHLEFFKLLLSRWPENISSSLAETDWQVLVDYALRYSPHRDATQLASLLKAQGLAVVFAVQDRATGASYGELFKNLLTGEFFSSAEYLANSKPTFGGSELQPATTRSERDIFSAHHNVVQGEKPTPSAAGFPAASTENFAEVLRDHADVDISQNQDLRWQEFLRQLQRGQIALGDLHLTDSSGVQIIAHYLSQAGHIKSEYRQNLLASISSMSRRAADTAEYFRRIIHCLIYQQPLDFDEILGSKDFWPKREKSTASTSAHKWDDAVVVEASVDETSPKAMIERGTVSPVEPAPDTQDYDQQLWRLLERIKKPAASPLQCSLAQLQQLLEFYLARSTGLDDQFRGELATAIAKRATNLHSQEQRFNYYANVLQRLLSSLDIELDDGQLLQPANWAQLLTSQSGAALNNPAINNASINSASINSSPITGSSADTSSIDQLSMADALSTTYVAVGRDSIIADAAVETAAIVNAVQESAADLSGEFIRTESLVDLIYRLQQGVYQLDELALTETQWRKLVDTFIDHSRHIAVDEKNTLLSQLVAGSENAWREWLRRELQSTRIAALVNLSIASDADLSALENNSAATSARGAESSFNRTQASTNSTLASVNDTQPSSNTALSHSDSTREQFHDTQLQSYDLGLQRNDSDVQRNDSNVQRDESKVQVKDVAESCLETGYSLQDLLLFAEASDITAIQRDALQKLVGILKAGVLRVSDLGASPLQLVGLTRFVIATQAQPLHIKAMPEPGKAAAYYASLLQALVDADSSALAAIVNRELIADHQITANSETGADDETHVDDEAALSVADVLAAAEKSAHQALDQKSHRALLALGDLIASKKIRISQLQASQAQLIGLVNFLMFHRPGAVPQQVAQLKAAIEARATSAKNLYSYYANILHKLLEGALLDLDELSASPSPAAVNLSVQHYFAPAVNKTPTATSVAGKIYAEDSSRLASRDDEVMVKTPATNTQLQQPQPAVMRKNAMPDADVTSTQSSEDQSLLELLLLPSLTSGQSIRLQQQIQTLLNRGRADAIKLWLNTSLSETAMQRLIKLLPDYALHHLLRLTYADAYQRVYGEAKLVLDVLAMAVPGVLTAVIHAEKWLFVMRQVLSNRKPDHDMLFNFAQQLATAAAVSDIATLQKLLRERLALNTNEAKSAQQESRSSSDSEALLQAALEEGIHISNAGQVIAAPYMGRLFAMLQLTDQGQFVSLAAKDRAIHLLEYMVTGSGTAPEYDLLLNKVLCGMGTSIPISAAIDITEQEETIISQLLNSIIQNWPPLKSTSIAGLRETFLCRQGWLRLDEDGWHLRVQPGPFDMLLDQLPWSFSLIKHGWMDQPLRVSWRE